MCGICGFTSKIIDQKKHLSQMMPFLRSRGPDSEGIYYDDKISLGHTRLSIIDLNKRSNQPLIDSKSGVSLVFNGEIYNFQEIKKKLKEEKNSIFLTTSDTEVILKSYLTYGLDCFAKFDGMFAIGIWDPRYSRLILSRDKFGEKPLYYNFFFNNGKRQLSFASNLNALRFSPNFKATINKKSLKAYLINNYVNNQETFYEGVENVEPGSLLIFENNKIIKKKYFDIKKYFKKPKKYEKFNVSEFDEILRKSVETRLISDVDIGVFLSGGIDSSIISAIAKQHNNKIKSFTLGFEEESYDETSNAKIVSKYLNIENETYILKKNDLLEIEKVVNSFGEPLADTSIIPTYFLSKFVKEKVKVSLTGDGGDELFFGYDTYTASKYYNILKKFNINYIFKILNKFSKFIPQKKTKVNYNYALKKFIEALNIKDKDFYVHEFWRQVNDQKSLEKILNKDFYSEIKNLEIHKYDFKELDINEDAHNNLCDFNFFLERDILVKSDRCSMANSLELRSPFLSNDLFEYMSRLDPSDKFKAFNKKNILKKTALNYLPKGIVSQKKRGFNAPVSYWFNNIFNGILRDLLQTQKTKSIFNVSYIEKLLIDNKNDNHDNGNILFNLFCLVIWINNNDINL